MGIDLKKSFFITRIFAAAMFAKKVIYKQYTDLMSLASLSQAYIKLVLKKAYVILLCNVFSITNFVKICCF